MYSTEAAFTEQVVCEIRRASLFRELDDGDRKTVVLNEVGLGYGVADIVVAHAEKSAKRKRKDLNKTDFFVYNCVTMCPGRDIEWLSTATKIGNRTLKITIDKLLRAHLITEQTDKYYGFNDYEFCFSESFAIEVKLKNWRRALRQAYRYKWFSEKSFVCLPEDNSTQAQQHLEMFQRLAVGLMVVSDDGELKTVFAPPTEKPLDVVMKMMLNEELLTRLHDS